jgi:hypothetical protein
VGSTYGSSDYGSYKTAASSEKKKGGDEAHSRTGNLEQNQTKQDCLAKGPKKAAIAKKIAADIVKQAASNELHLGE